MGAKGCVSGTVCTPPPESFPSRGFWVGCCGADRVDTSVLLAAGLLTASVVACQGSINFLLEESVCTTEWTRFSQGQLLAPASAPGGCRGGEGPALGTSEQRRVGQSGWGRLPGGGEDRAGCTEITVHVGQAGEGAWDTWGAQKLGCGCEACCGGLCTCVCPCTCVPGLGYALGSCSPGASHLSSTASPWATSKTNRPPPTWTSTCTNCAPVT